MEIQLSKPGGSKGKQLSGGGDWGLGSLIGGGAFPEKGDLREVPGPPEGG